MANKNLVNEIIKAIKNCNEWMGGAVVARLNDGSFEAMPAVAANDPMDTRRSTIDEVVLTIADAYEIPMGDMEYSDLIANESELRSLAEWYAENLDI